jgi:hypothetical protein
LLSRSDLQRERLPPVLERPFVMIIDRRVLLFTILVVACLALPANAADRVRAGEWSATTTAGGKMFATSSCISKSDAEAMNGDATSVQAYLEKIIPPEICKITNLKVNGMQVVYTGTCVGSPSKVVTTTYHGNSSEGSDSLGSSTKATLVGPCN